jgi:hypothetical protein
MPALLIRIDDHTSKQLETMSRSEGVGAEDLAARLLRRAIINARPRARFDADTVLHSNAPFAQEDLELAESDSEHRLASLDLRTTHNRPPSNPHS